MAMETTTPALAEQIKAYAHNSKTFRVYKRDHPYEALHDQWDLDARLKKPAFITYAEQFLRRNVDALHGMSSAGLLTAMEKGLVPSSLHESLGVVAVGLEHHSQPLKREGTHVVPWWLANKTTRYAEDRVAPRQHYFVTYDNMDVLAGTDISEYETAGPGKTWALDHVVGAVREARAHKIRIANGELNGLGLELFKHPFPVVLGIDTRAIDEQRMKGVFESIVDCDVSITGVVAPEAIPAIYVPADRFDITQQVLATTQQEQIAILALEDLRSYAA